MHLATILATTGPEAPYEDAHNAYYVKSCVFALRLLTPHRKFSLPLTVHTRLALARTADAHRKIDEEDFACSSSSLHSQLLEQPLLELSHCMRLSMPPRMHEIVANVADTVADMTKRADQLTAGQLLLS